MNTKNHHEPVYTLKEIRKALGIGALPTDTQLYQEQFANASRVHDWRNYVYAPQWQNHSDLERVIFYAFAVRKADDEEWD